MSKKNSAIKNLTEAHGWLGVIFSIFLFVVFWGGSLSLFRAEIKQWAELPHYPVSTQTDVKSLSEVISPLVKQYSLNTKKPLRVFLPNENQPLYRVRLPLKDKRLLLKIDSRSGEVMASESKFELIDFIYELHYNLQLSRFGLYFIGVVTLFFLFALLSGVFIHAKKIGKHFFSYRISKTRTKLLDLHNLVGVMSLPFTLMYALTGLIFNLLVVFQIAFVVFIYQGDLTAMTADAGFNRFKPPALVGTQTNMKAVNAILTDSEEQYGPAGFVSLYNYGDENAVIQIFGKSQGSFEPRYELYVRIRDGLVLRQEGIETSNTFKQGRRVLSKLHFGSFAGFDLRVLYFILGMAVTAMIVVGNILWINKRQNSRNASDGVTNFVSNLTLGVCGGMILATATGLLAERAIPLIITDRANWVIGTFLATLLITSAYAFRILDKKRFIALALNLTSAVLLVTVVASWLLFSDTLIALWQQGYKPVIAVDIGLLLSAILCFIASRSLHSAVTRQTDVLANMATKPE